jgi:hypothetical protein
MHSLNGKNDHGCCGCVNIMVTYDTFLGLVGKQTQEDLVASFFNLMKIFGLNRPAQKGADHVLLYVNL